jgi:hypothetical protein
MAAKKAAPDPPEDAAPPETTEAAAKAPPAEATCERFPNGWSLIRAGMWEISVGPDGLLMLPRHLDPREVNDFVTSAIAAAEEGARIQEENKAKEKATPLELPPRRAMVTPAGQVPAGATPMTVSAVGSNQRVPEGSIGRRAVAGRRQQTNREAMPGQRPRR